MGAHKYVCDECGYEEIAYNSCRNRHCPNCQTGKKLKWIEARKEEVLNIKYYLKHQQKHGKNQQKTKNIQEEKQDFLVYYIHGDKI